MAITTVQPGSGKLRAIEVLKLCLGPGGVVLSPGQQVKVPEGDAHTLVSGEQAKFLDESKAKS